MPLVHKVDGLREWLITHATGPIRYEDIRDHLLAEERDHYIAYPELIDGTSATVAFTSQDVRRIVQRVRTTAASQTFGPTAVVVGDEVAYGMMRMLEIMLDDVVSVRPFRTLAAAEQWLLNLAAAPHQK
jgi:hypothetical protein